VIELTSIRVNNIKLFYRVNGEGPAVLLIHGLGGDIRGWEFQEDELAKHFTLLMPELRGHGRSGGPDAPVVTAKMFAEDLAVFLKTLGYDDVHVVGHSMGGVIAQQFTLDFPELVRKLVLIDTAPKITEETIDEVYSWREAQVEGGQEAYHLAATKSTYSEEFIENNRDLIDYLLNREDLVNEEGVLAAGLGLASFDVTEKLSDIRVETLIIHGESDRIIDYSLGKILHEEIPNSELVSFPKCGHSPTVEKREILGQILIDFLS
jgi:pimeloyl-ACP methyl ester carboxylesterase